MKYSKALMSAVLGLSAMVPGFSHAAVVIDITQVGTNVGAVLSGSLNLSGLFSGPVLNSVVQVRGTDRAFFSTTNGAVQSYAGFQGPATFGTGTVRTTASSATGSAFSFSGGFANSGTLLFLDPAYVSGSALSASLSFNDITLAGLGLAEGQYIYTSPSDTITFNIGSFAAPAATLAAAVPESGTWAMMLVGFGAIGAVMRRRRTARPILA